MEKNDLQVTHVCYVMFDQAKSPVLKAKHELWFSSLSPSTLTHLVYQLDEF